MKSLALVTIILLVLCWHDFVSGFTTRTTTPHVTGAKTGMALSEKRVLTTASDIIRGRDTTDAPPTALILQQQNPHKTITTTIIHRDDDDCAYCDNNEKGNLVSVLSAVMMIPTILMMAFLPLPAYAAVGGGTGTAVLPTALWAYGHFFSILVITGCLAAERILVKPNMSIQEEDTVVKLDLVYGLMAALLIGSGFARATNYGQGSDYYVHEILFWVKMSVSGIWGGLSLFPSLTFYRRNFARKNDQVVPPVSEALAARLQQIINAELSAMLSIPLLATLMARGVWYWDDFPWPVGLTIAILATAGSFFLYARQALTWTEEEIVVVEND